MPNATTRVRTEVVRWGTDRIYVPAAAAATSYYSGAMLARDGSGNAVHADDTAGIAFLGIMDDPVTVVVPSGSSAGDYTLQAQRPFRFKMAIAAAVAGDEGKAVYASSDQLVAYSTSNSILVGWVDQVLSATLVLIQPSYAPFSPAAIVNNVLAFTGTTGVDAITVPDNLADALHISQASNVFAKFTTTDGSEVGLYGAPGATAVTNAGGAVQVVAGVGGATSGVGGLVTITAGAAGAGSSAGGTVIIAGGAGGGTAGAGGLVSLTGGAATAGNAAGGAASLVGGLGVGSSAGGAVTITSGAAGATGVAGAVNISVGAATAGNGSALTLTGGNGAGGGTQSGGNVNLVPGTAQTTGNPGEVLVNAAAGLFEINWQQFLSANVPVSGTSYGVYLANRAVRVKGVRITCSSTATVPTVDVIKDTGTTAPGGGTSVLTGVATFNTTANTTVTGTVSTTIATVTLAAGDRLTLKWGGTVGAITGAMVNILLVPV